MKVIKVSYFKDGEEGACEFFKENADINNVKASADKFNMKFNCTSEIKVIEVKYILLVEKGNNTSHYDCWVVYFDETEYQLALDMYNDEKENVNKNDDKTIVELITL